MTLKIKRKWTSKKSLTYIYIFSFKNCLIACTHNLIGNMLVHRGDHSNVISCSPSKKFGNKILICCYFSLSCNILEYSIYYFPFLMNEIAIILSRKFQIIMILPHLYEWIYKFEWINLNFIHNLHSHEWQ